MSKKIYYFSNMKCRCFSLLDPEKQMNDSIEVIVSDLWSDQIYENRKGVITLSKQDTYSLAKSVSNAYDEGVVVFVVNSISTDSEMKRLWSLVKDSSISDMFMTAVPANDGDDSLDNWHFDCPGTNRYRMLKMKMLSGNLDQI